MGVQSSSVIQRAGYDPKEYPKYGLKMSYMDEFCQLCGGDDASTFDGMTTTDVCNIFVKPQTLRYETSFCEMLYRNNHPAVGVATIFVSHAWKYQFCDVVEALKNYIAKECPTEDPFLWFDLFSNNQHGTDERNFDWWCTTFKSAIESFGKVVMVISPWKDPIPLTRAWCLFELYCTSVTNCQFAVAMSDSEKATFLKSLKEEGVSGFVSMIACIDSRRSEAFKPSDLESIFGVIQASVGFDALNSLVITKLRAWVINIALEARSQLRTKAETDLMDISIGELYIEQGKPKLAAPYIEPLALDCFQSLGSLKSQRVLFAMGRLERERGNYVMAERYYRSVRATAHGKVLDAVNQALGSVYAHMGKLDVAEGFYKLALENRVVVSSSGSLDPESLNVESLGLLNDLALIFMQQCKFTQALNLFLLCKEQQTRLIGKDHPLTLNAHNNLAVCYLQLDKLDEAKENFKMVYLIRKTKLGPTHPLTLLTLTNLGDCTRRYLTEATVREAILLLEECWQGYQSIHDFSMEVPNGDACLCLYYLSMAYGNVGENERTIPLLKLALEGRRQHLGKAHHITLESVMALAKAYNSLDRYDEAAQVCDVGIESIKEAILSVTDDPSGVEDVIATDQKSLFVELLDLMDFQAVTYSSCKRHEEALAVVSEAIRMLRKQIDLQSRTATASNASYSNYSSSSSFSSSSINDSNDVGRVELASNFPEHLVMLLLSRSTIYANMVGQRSKTLTSFQETLGTAFDTLQPSNPQVLKVIELYATVLLKFDEPFRALAVYRQQLKLLVAVREHDDAHFRQAVSRIFAMHQALGDNVDQLILFLAEECGIVV